MKTYVLDTSVIIKWFSEYDEDDLDKALTLRNIIVEDKCSITVPDLIFYELAYFVCQPRRFYELPTFIFTGRIVPSGYIIVIASHGQYCAQLVQPIQTSGFTTFKPLN